MPRKVLCLSLAVTALLVVLEGVGAQSAIAGERWRRPLPGGAVVGAFSFERSAPYVRGRRRGVDFAGTPGTPVLAACDGTVTYAGRVPEPRFGRGVTIRCDRLVATELGLSVAFVRRGAHVTSGAPVGVLAASGTLRLGARVATDRQGYLDPLPLIDDAPPSIAPPVVPRSHNRRTRPAARSPYAAPASRPAPGTFPWPAFAGLALVTTAAAGGGAMRAHHRRRTQRQTAPATR
ncbi:hypothetical protein DSM104299_01072 [Baekduia alba]|uniref:peptidoglycan DD-metalloendopeptidase family protein n=1 Tax=Baekduia alba TaxID=2997333 RepID=UPI002340F19F|nr:peptidoglycan DD-metalloendopeptidase family protein [Baekduia alba]WCB92379.1 hypothetical protein DSM104299_01072 [Baekduia alba]